MMTLASRRRLAVLVVLGSFAATAGNAAPRYPDRYIDPDSLRPGYNSPPVAAWPGGLAAFEGRPYRVFQGTGRVDDVDFSGPKVVIGGHRYRFAPLADIRLQAGAGAPTLLEPGMLLEYYFVPDSLGAKDDEGHIVAAIELPAAPVEAD